MASLTINVPDELVPRIRAAFGKWDNLDPTLRIPATAAELQAAIKAFVRATTLEFETGEAAKTKRSELNGENWNG